MVMTSKHVCKLPKEYAVNQTACGFFGLSFLPDFAHPRKMDPLFLPSTNLLLLFFL